MELTREIKINIPYKKGNFIARRADINLLLGTSYADIYLIKKLGGKKKDNRWILPRKAVEERLKTIQGRSEDLIRKANILKSVLKGTKK